MVNELKLLYPSKEEARRVYNREWRKRNIETITKNHKAWKKDNPESECFKWHKKHPENVKRNKQRWYKTSKGKHCCAKQKAKRKSDMGYEPLNEPFACSEGHHINKNQVVYVPKELHRKYPHNHRKPETMVEINRTAMQYLFNCKY